MKKLAAIFLFLSFTTAHADDFSINPTPGLSGSITGMTNYISRGIGQNGGKPAINTTVSYQVENGLLGNIGAVNSIQGNGNVEVDLTVGYATKITDEFYYQTNIVYANYPGSSNYNNISTLEFQHIFNYVQDWGKLVGAVGVQPQGQNHAGVYSYTSGGADFNLPKEITLGFRAGYNTNSNHEVYPNFIDWSVTVSRPITDWATWSIQYSGSTNYKKELMNEKGQHVVATISLSF